MEQPTDQQSNIINYDGNAVVLASPGSGKTFVLSEMIKRTLTSENLQPYQGVIAISFTRKASANLKSRVLSSDIDCKNSFFGTIDKFCLMQIIFEFGHHVFGRAKKDLETINLSPNMNNYSDYKWIKEQYPDYGSISEEQFDALQALYLDGYVLIESLGLITLHILNKSLACKRYIQTVFSHIYIDEFQDVDTYINEIFLKFAEWGVKCIAVGDTNQSIFEFAHKSNKYLTNLKTNPNFRYFPLNINFRCSKSIVEYSSRLLDSNYAVIQPDTEGIILIRIVANGSYEKHIAEYIDKIIDRICKKWDVERLSDVAILTQNSRTHDLIHAHLKTPHNVVKTTDLDLDLNPVSRLFSNLLRFICNDDISFAEVFEGYLDYDDLKKAEKEKYISLFDRLRICSLDNINDILAIMEEFANLAFPIQSKVKSLDLLQKVLSDKDLLNSYSPINPDEIQIMTLHKSKGLEFDVVFHLNLNEWELPHREYNSNPNKPSYSTWNQDIFLHYVGITRARKVCYFVRSDMRTNRKNELKKATDSIFLNLNGLNDLRKSYSISKL